MIQRELMRAGDRHDWDGCNVLEKELQDTKKARLDILGEGNSVTAEEVISMDDLLALPEYSVTVPTGVTIGKRWRAATVIARLDPRETTEWLIGTYVDSSKEGYANIVWTRAVEEPGAPHRTRR